MIVDSHTHVVSPDEVRYPQKPLGLDARVVSDAARPWYREVPVSAEGLLETTAAAGVDRAVLVQAVAPYGDDNSYAVEAAARFPGRFTSVVFVDVARSADPAATLRDWVRRGARGVRLFTATQPEGLWLDEAPGHALWRCAASLGIPVVVTILAGQIPRLASALGRFPDVPVALDHCAFPDLAGGPPFAAARPLFDLAAHRNLRLKVSSIVLERAGRDAAALVRALADAFGAERLLWGSDYSQTRFADYAGLVALGEASAARLSSEERRSFLGGAALELWPELGSGG